jgi:hypothetical protein
MANDNQSSLFSLSPVEKTAVIATGVLALVTVAMAWIGFAFHSAFVMAFFLGCVGGLMHELFQSGGKVLFFEKKEDGLYLGALAGMLLGGVSGLLSARSVDSANVLQFNALAYDAFLAGMGMKGLAEAAAGSAVSKTDSALAPKVLASLPTAPASVQPPNF